LLITFSLLHTLTD